MFQSYDGCGCFAAAAKNRSCALSLIVQKLDIYTVIFHYIQRQSKFNICNKMHITNIPLYFVLQQHFFEDIIKVKLKFIYFLHSNSFFVCLWCLWLMFLCLSHSAEINSRTHSYKVHCPHLQLNPAFSVHFGHIACFIYFVSLLIFSGPTCP